jgi:hypothetical protein
VKARCIAAAKEHGITLTIDHIAVGLGEVRLVTVTFALDGVPEIFARADDAQVTLSGLSPANATVHGLTLAIDGPASELEGAIDRWRAEQARHTTAVEAASAQRIAFVHAHITWTKAFGQGAKIETSDAEGEADARAGSLQLTAEQLKLTAGKVTFGPWRTTLERNAQGTRTDVELDPVVRGGPTAIYVRSIDGAVSVRVNVPRSPISRLGLPPKDLGLGSDPDVEAQISFDETLAGAASLTAAVSLSHAVFSGMPVDAQLRFAAAGTTSKGLDVKEGTLHAGPLVATVSGTVKLFDDGARLALAWTATPVPCIEVGKQLAAQALGQLGAQLGAIAADVGGAIGMRVTGATLASGLITLDSRDVNATAFTVTANETCGLALF